MTSVRQFPAKEYHRCGQCQGTGLVQPLREMTTNQGPMGWGGEHSCHACGGSGCVAVPVWIDMVIYQPGSTIGE